MRSPARWLGTMLLAVACVWLLPACSEDGASCGNAKVEAEEQCDDGNEIDADGCTNECTLPRCGDAIVQAGEECDDGNPYDDDACTRQCRNARCTDGFIQPGEECDDGNVDAHDACTNDCTVATCGDGIVRVGIEECDDANDDDTDGCTADCRGARCGDGIVQAGEECDDGNTTETDDCTGACLDARCGDGIVQAGVEQCDDANRDNEDACTNACETARCGDGFVQIGVEACDDANDDDTDGCTTACQHPSCGDGIVQNGEACDDGNDDDHDGCRTDCQQATCGDGIVRYGFEECDDGNGDEDDACTTACLLARCGDGFVRLGLELCDDGNGDNGDACLTTCQPATCGDGFVRRGVEACDDGNLSDHDACRTDCMPASCGDGFVWAGVEACDDGNADDSDACLSNCVPARCGDGIVQMGAEECDDANRDNTDGCLMSCQRFDWCAGFDVIEMAPPVICEGGVPSQVELTATGRGFLRITGHEPTVTFAGNPTTFTLADCSPIFGAYTDAEGCLRMTVDVPNAGTLDVGDYPIEIVNPVTADCRDTWMFQVSPPPQLLDVEPRVACEGDATFDFLGNGLANGTSAWLDDVAAISTSLVEEGRLRADFVGLEPGNYDATVGNGPECQSTLPDAVTIVPNPVVVFVDPPVVYNGVPLQITIYVSGINGGAINSVAVRPAGTDDPLTYLGNIVYNPDSPNRVQAQVPPNLIEAGETTTFDVLVEDGLGCQGWLYGRVDLTRLISLDLRSINPPFGWHESSTAVALRAGDPPQAGETGFVNLPRLYLNPVAASGVAASPINTVAFVDPALVTALVPPNLQVGDYDVIVVNPTGEVGRIPAGFRVTEEPPPIVDAVSPGSIPSTPQRVAVLGENFADPVVTLSCQAPDGTLYPHSTTNFSVTPTRIEVDILGDQILNDSVCVVRVTNADESYGDFSALAVTEPSENIPDGRPEPLMDQERVSPAVAVGRSTRLAQFLYAIGGDSGDPSAPLATIEAAPLDEFGALGAWRYLPQPLPGGKTRAQAHALGRFIYLVGGLGDSGATSEALRAEVLRPEDAPVISDLEVTLVDTGPETGLAPGIWYYRVAAVMVGDDPDNPDGETLPSDPQPLIVPDGLDRGLRITLFWDTVPGAAEYRIYRSPVPDLASGNEELISVEPAGTLSYHDDGSDMTTGEVPRSVGDLGEWAPVANMPGARSWLGLTSGRDPADPSTWYLYAVGGFDGGGATVDTYSYLPVELDGDGGQTAGAWDEDLANPLGAGRGQLGAARIDLATTTRLPEADTWVIAGSGLSAGGTLVRVTESARVLTGGLLDTWAPVKSGNSGPARAGYGFAAASNQVFFFGGANASPSNDEDSGQICGDGYTCGTYGEIQNWNSTGSQMAEARYLMGSTVGSARIFLVGGETPAGPTRTVESTIW